MTVSRHTGVSERRVADAVAALQRSLSVGAPRAARRRLAVLDTVDWRVHRAGGSLVIEDRHDGVWLVRRDAHGTIAHRLRVPGRPTTAADLPPGPLRADLEAAGGDRRLVPLVEATGRRRTLDVLDTRRKTVARLHVDRLRATAPDGQTRTLPPALVVEPLRGYDGDAERLRHAVEDLLGAAGPGEVESLLAAVGRRPLDTAVVGRSTQEGPACLTATGLHELLFAPVRLAAAAVAPADDDAPRIDRKVTRVVGTAARRARALLRALPSAMADTELDGHLRAIARAARHHGDALGLARRLRRWRDDDADRRVAGAHAPALDRRHAALVAALAAGAGVESRAGDAAVDDALTARLAVRLARAWAAALDPGAERAALAGPADGRGARRLAARLERAVALVGALGPLARPRDAEATLELLATALDLAERLRARSAWRGSIVSATRTLGDPAALAAGRALVGRVDREWRTAAGRLPGALDAARTSRRAARLLADVTARAAS